MDRDSMFEKFQELLYQEFDIEKEDVSMDSRLYEDLDLDSIDAVDLMAWIVKITGQRMAPEDFRNVRTVRDVIDELDRQLT